MDAMTRLHGKIHELTKESAFDGKPFVLSRELAHWLQSPPDDQLEDTNWDYLTSTLSNENGDSSALRHLQVDEYMKIISTLVEINYPSAAHAFVRRHITDNDLPIDAEGLRDIASFEPKVFPVPATLEFFRVQWRYLPAQLEPGRISSSSPETVLPFCSRELIGVGNTAKVFRVEIPEEFVRDELLELLPQARVKDEKHEELSCVQLALKTYTGRLIPIGRNEARAYQSLSKDSSFLRYVADFEATEQNTNLPNSLVDLKNTSESFNILLEWGDETLEEYFVNHSPPVLQHDIFSFWHELISIARAVEKLHNFNVISQGEEGSRRTLRYHGYHSDIKPDNIVRAGSSFRLSDLGFAHLWDSSRMICDIPSRQYLTYNPPETNQYTELISMRAIDVWSLGCVFSIAATWAVLGPDGVNTYRELRTMETKALVDAEPTSNKLSATKVDEPNRLSIPGDYFHNGSRVLETVTRFHRLVRQSARRIDNITPKVLDVVDIGMLVAQSERMTARDVCDKLSTVLNECKECAVEDEFRDWRDVLGPSEGPGSITTLSPTENIRECSQAEQAIESPPGPGVLLSPSGTVKEHDLSTHGELNRTSLNGATDGYVAEPNSSTPVGRDSSPPQRKPRPINPAIRGRWMKVMKRLAIVTLPRWIITGARKNTEAPCPQCASMKLTEAKFFIQESGKHRATVRNKDQRPTQANDDALGPEGFEFGPIEFCIGTLREIHSRQGRCPFCRMLVNSVDSQILGEFLLEPPGNTDVESYKPPPDVSCYLSWEIDGRIVVRDELGSVKSSRPCTLRLRVRWDNKKLSESFVVLVEKKGATQNLFLASSIQTLSTDTALVQQWLRICDESHGPLCNSRTSDFEVPKPFFGVIDVKMMCLSKLPKGARYIALSYVWGQDQPWTLKTTRANIKNLMRPQGLDEHSPALSRTVRDSIELVKDCGERYLWVDALCIIQDSDRSWALNACLMDVVYGNAFFTICAADGSDANAGLQALRFRDTRSENIAFYSPDVRLKCCQPAENYIRESTWNTRGWTFQERLLSPRTLIFVDGRMFFQCRSTAKLIDIITEDEYAGCSIEFRDSPYLMLEKMTKQPLLIYKESLRLYMKRRLTYPKDILAAFTGIGNLVCNALGGSLVYGLPSSHFDWALLWEPRQAVPRHPEEGRAKFPSWSWCGWKIEQLEIQYKEQMLAGIEDNLHDWLMNHTWITWYIRDGNGNLRLVWNANDAKKGSTKAESTWKGYKHPQPSVGEGAYDPYGRAIKPSEQHLPRDRDFTLILDDYPFDAQIVQDVETHITNSTEKDMPFLQFYSWSAFFRIRVDKRFTYKPGENFRRYDIEDYKDDWCGTIMLDRMWVERKEHEFDKPIEFVAISDAKQFDDEEYNDWAHYIPLEKKQITWDLYYVLLIEKEYRSDIAYRVGLGKVYKEAFENSGEKGGKQWKEFILG